MIEYAVSVIAGTKHMRFGGFSLILGLYIVVVSYGRRGILLQKYINLLILNMSRYYKNIID